MPVAVRAPVKRAYAITVMGLFACLVISRTADAASLKVAWDPSTSKGTAGYVIWFGTSSGRYDNAINVGAGTSYAVSGLWSMTKYYFAVQTYTLDGELSALSSEVAGITSSESGIPLPGPTLPPAPYRLAGVMGEDGIAELVWEAPTVGASAYQIEIGTAPGRTDVSRFITGPATSFAIGNLPPLAYYMRVRSQTQTGLVSAPSNEVTVEAPGGRHAPGRLSVTLRAGGVTRFAWDAPANRTGLAGYLVELGSAPGRSDLGRMAVATREISLPGIANRIYFVRVRTLKISSIGPASREVVVQLGNNTPCTAAPRSPTLVAPAFGTTGQLSWSAAGGEQPTGYLLEYLDATAEPAGGSLTSQFSASTTTVWAPAPEGTYAFRLRAANKCGASELVPESLAIVDAAAHPLPGPPVGLDYEVSGRSLSLTWSPPFSGGEPTHYVIEVTDDRNVVVLTVNTRSTSTGLVYDAVPPGKYVVRVRAGNASGLGMVSDSVTVVIGP